MTKQTKIIISVVLSCTLLLLLFIPSFAEDDPSVISSGTYTWNNTITVFNDISTYSDLFIPLNFTTETLEIEGFTFGNWNGIYFTYNPSNESYIVSYSTGNSDVPSVPVYSSEHGWSTSNNIDVSFPIGYGQTINISSDQSVSSVFFNYASSNWTIEQPYSGNPFSDIMDMVIDALDVPLFGTFSLWDMLTTVCGLFAVVWLLKLLAGG